MAVKIFIDANIILDYALKRPVGYEPAKKILQKIIAGEHRGYTSSVVIHIVGHMLKKYLKARKTRKIILALLNDIEIIGSPQNTLVQAFSSGWNDFEDAIQYYTALKHDMDFIISRDKGFIKKALPSLPVLTPDEFLSTSR